MSVRLTILGLTSAFVFVGCSSAQKARMAEREKVSAASGMYCEFISGDVHNDLDVELNLQMGKRCDANKPFSMTNFKNSSENSGVIYCCSVAKKEEKKDEKKVETRHFGPKDDQPEAALDMKAEAKKPEDKKDEKTEKAPAPKPEAKPAGGGTSAPSSAPTAPTTGSGASQPSSSSSSSASTPKKAPANSPKPKAPQHSPASADDVPIMGQ